MTDNLPGLSEELVASLEARFPPRCMYQGESLEAHQRYAGKVELVGHLRTLLTDYGDSTTKLRIEDIIEGEG